MDEMQQLIVALVQAAMQGDQQATLQIQQIEQAAQQGDQQAAQMMLMINAISKQLATSAKNGAKLQYIQRLRNKCPEGYEMEYFKAGGKVCSKCAKKAAKAKMEKGGSTEPEYIKTFKAKCGAKMKK